MLWRKIDVVQTNLMKNYPQWEAPYPADWFLK